MPAGRRRAATRPVSDRLGERLSLEELHREPRHTGARVDARRDDIHDVLALDPPAHLRLLREALAERGIGDELRMHRLQRALLADAELASARLSNRRRTRRARKRPCVRQRRARTSWGYR